MHSHQTERDAVLQLHMVSGNMSPLLYLPPNCKCGPSCQAPAWKPARLANCLKEWQGFRYIRIRLRCSSDAVSQVHMTEKYECIRIGRHLQKWTKLLGEPAWIQQVLQIVTRWQGFRYIRIRLRCSSAVKVLLKSTRGRRVHKNWQTPANVDQVVKHQVIESSKACKLFEGDKDSDIFASD